MAKQKTVWIDDAGNEHDDENSADRANIRFKAEDVIRKLGVFDLGLFALEGVNHQTLQPLQAYIDLLVRESMERTERYGGPTRSPAVADGYAVHQGESDG